MGYSNVQGDLNVLSTTSTQNLFVRGDTTHLGNITSTQGFATFGNVSVGNLLVTGNFTITATNTQTTNSLTINNSGTATALKVIQFEGGGGGHAYNVAEFWDFTTLAMVIDPEGNVGIHTTSSPGYALTVRQGASFDTLTSQLYTGNGSGISNLNSSNLVNPLTSLQLSNTQSNITSLGTLVNLNVSGTANIATGWFVSANVTGGLGANTAFFNLLKTNTSNTGFLNAANGAVSNLLCSNINVITTANMAALTVTGILNGGLLIGNASGLSNLNSSNLVGNVAAANVASSVTNPAQPNITSVGVLTGLNVSGTSNLFTLNVVSGNVITSNLTNLTVGGTAIVGPAPTAVQANLHVEQGSIFIGNSAAVGATLNTTSITQGTLIFDNTANASIIPNKIVLFSNAAGGVYGGFGIGNATGGTTLDITYRSRSTHIFYIGVNAATEAMRIGSSGGVSLGSTGTNIAKLYVAGTFINSNIHVRIDSSNIALVTSGSGLVGFGTLAPTANLHVIGNVFASNALSTSNIFLTGNANILGYANIVTLNAASGNLVTANILTLNVTTANLSSANIASGNLVTANILTLNVTTANLVTANILTLNVTTANLSSANIASGNLVTANILTLNATTVNISTGNLVTGNIATLNVVTANISNNFVSNLTANTLTVTGAITANATNTIFSFDTFTVPFIYSTTINVSSYANIVTLNTASANLSSANIASGNLVTANILTLNATTANLSTANIASGNLVTANILTLNVTTDNVTNLTVRTLANIATLNVYTSANIITGNIVTANAANMTVSTLANIATLNVYTSANIITGNIVTANAANMTVRTLANIATLNVYTSANIITGNLVTANAANMTVSTLANIATLNVYTSSNILVGNLVTANITNLTVSSQANIFSSNIVTANVQTLNVATPIAASSGLFMNLNATYTLNSTGNWTGNIASTITSNLYTLFASNPTASWTTYGSNPLVTGPTANGGFKFSQTGAWAFTAVITSDQNIKTLALSANTSDVHSNLADTGVWQYCYRIGVGQDPSVPITIPFYVSDTSRYYFLDIEAVNQVDNIHRTAYTNTTAEAYTGSYVILKPL